jgi:phage shock protein C
LNVAARLTKSETDRVIDGVCGGVAEYFGVDSTVIRLVFVVLALINGLGILLYIILMIIMPRQEEGERRHKVPIDTLE